MMRRSDLNPLRTVIILTAFTASVHCANGQEEPAEPPEEVAPSILNPEDIFSEERKMLRKLTTGEYPFRRGIFKDDIQIKSKQVRLESQKKISLVWGRPKKAKLAPAVFIIDVESAALSNQPSRRFFGRAKSRRAQRENEARYLLTSPFGSNLLGHGFVVAYAVAKDLDTLRSARTTDWIDMFDEIRDLKEVDESSFFLMSTKEYANLSVYLASTYSFSGFILEEPHYMLFTRQTHQDVIEESKWLTSDQIWRRTDPSRRDFYHKIFSNIYSPIMIIRSEDSPAYDFNEKTLIDSLKASNTYFETITLNQVPRRLMPLGDSDGVMNTEPRVSYNPTSVSTWLEGMINYLKINSDTMPTELQKRAIIY